MKDLAMALRSMGLSLPVAPKPVAAYVPAVRSGHLIFVSGQLPTREGELLAEGPVPSKVSVEDAKKAAQQCALNALAIVDAQLGGDWSRLERIVRIGCYVCSDPDFTHQPQVANGASEMLGELFGEAGQHSRVTLGVLALPLGASVELEMVVEVK